MTKKRDDEYDEKEFELATAIIASKLMKTLDLHGHGSIGTRAIYIALRRTWLAARDKKLRDANIKRTWIELGKF